MRHATGPGKIFEFDWVDSDLVMTANLYNFDIDGADLKLEHKSFLRERIVDYLNKYGFHIWLHGHSSRSGDYAYNVGLSKRRVENVTAFLKSLGVRDTQIQPQWDGPKDATPKKLEAEVDRSVSFHIQPGVTPIPPPIPPIIPVSNQFKIRILGAPAMGRPNTFIAEHFQIWDFRNGLTAYYSIPLDYPRAMEPSLNELAMMPFKGPWNLFLVTRGCLVTFFEGRTQMDRLSIQDSPQLRHVRVFLPVRYLSPSDETISGGTIPLVMDTGQFALWSQTTWDMHLTQRAAETFKGP
jgi:hypothetical protein